MFARGGTEALGFEHASPRPAPDSAVSASRSILLLGGTGFLGGHARRALLAAGHRVSVLARGTGPADGAERITADRADRESLARVIDGRRFVLTVDFLAWDAGDVECLFGAPRAALGRYILISSGQVYLVTDGAKPPYREADSDRPLMPEPPPGTFDHAQWRYGIGKRRAEAAALALLETHAVRATILRLPIVQGEGDGTLRLWAYLERMLDGGAILLPAGGEQPMGHLHAGDLARALVCLVHEPARSTVLNLAPRETLPLRELLERIAHAAGVSPRFVAASWDEMRRAGLSPACSPFAGRWSSVLDPARSALELGSAASPISGYLPSVVRWHLEHRPQRSHPGYAERPRELTLAAALTSTARSQFKTNN